MALLGGQSLTDARPTAARDFATRHAALGPVAVVEVDRLAALAMEAACDDELGAAS